MRLSTELPAMHKSYFFVILAMGSFIVASSSPHASPKKSHQTVVGMPPRHKISRQNSMNSVTSSTLSTPPRGGSPTGLTPKAQSMRLATPSALQGNRTTPFPAGVVSSPQNPFWDISPARLPLAYPSAPVTPILCSVENEAAVKEAEGAIESGIPVEIARALTKIKKSPNKSVERLAKPGVKRAFEALFGRAVDVTSPQDVTAVKHGLEDTTVVRRLDLQSQIKAAVKSDEGVQANPDIPAHIKVLRQGTYATRRQAVQAQLDPLLQEVADKAALASIVACGSPELQHSMHFLPVDHVQEGHIDECVPGDILWKHAYTKVRVKKVTSGPIAGQIKSVYSPKIKSFNLPRYVARLHNGMHFPIDNHQHLYADQLQNGATILSFTVNHPGDNPLTYRTVFPMFSCTDLTGHVAGDVYLGSFKDQTTKKTTPVHVPRSALKLMVAAAQASAGAQSYLSADGTKRITNITTQFYAARPHVPKDAGDRAAFWVMHDVATSRGAAGSAAP